MEAGRGRRREGGKKDCEDSPKDAREMHERFCVGGRSGSATEEFPRARRSTHTHTHARTHARKHACMHARTHARTYMCEHAHVHANTHGQAEGTHDLSFLPREGISEVNVLSLHSLQSKNQAGLVFNLNSSTASSKALLPYTSPPPPSYSLVNARCV